MCSNQIAKHMLDDTEAYGDFIQDMLSNHLDKHPELKKSWDKWFLALDPDINVTLPQPLNNISHATNV
jgi:hypothetical protein